jgi:deoxycytidylate deaminase
MIKKDKAEKYFQLAEHFAELFSKDPFRKVGALCLHPESLAILSQGYNGFARGVDELKPDRWAKPIRNINGVEHAERNCIQNAICRHGTALVMVVFAVGNDVSLF